MMTNAEARQIINSRINTFTGIERSLIQLANQPNFTLPVKGLWCNVTVQYTDSNVVCINDGGMERDYGFINIQCFAKRGVGDIALIDLADKWRAHWKNYGDSNFEVEKTHAPTPIYGELSDTYVMTLVRIEFRVN